MRQDFIDECLKIEWFSRSGCPGTDFDSVPDAVEPFDNPKYRYHEVWRSQTANLEKKALCLISGERIDEIFSATTRQMTGPVEKGLKRYFARRESRTENTKINADLGLWPEILEAALRDICWAHVELEIDTPGFFQQLLRVYEKGLWPCGWSGEFPDGKFVVL